MNRTIIGLLAIVGLVAVACSTDGKTQDDPEVVTCAIVTPEAGDLLYDTIDVQVDITGPATTVEILEGDDVLASTTIVEGEITATLSWDTSTMTDGEVALVARATSEAGVVGTSEPVTIDLDNTAPVAAFGESFPRISVVDGTVTVPLSIVEDNVASIRVFEGDVELFASEESAESFSWDTTEIEDGLHTLSIEVVDVIGRTGELIDHPVVVINNGEERTVGYDPATEVYIPTDYLSIDYHVRGQVTSWPGVREVITWVTWDGSLNWNIEYLIGQGICPHAGIEYSGDVSDSGEIIVALNRQDLIPEVVAQLPVEDQESDIFPHNGDILTFGAYFGHVNPIDAADHIEESLPITIGYVFLY